MKKHTLTIKEKSPFSPTKTFNCGQCFRFNEREDSVWGIVSGELVVFPKKQSRGKITYYSSGEGKLDAFLDAQTSYSEINKKIREFFSPEILPVIENAEETSSGLRILKQDFWETLVSFIISQNNNIPRIKKNVESLSALLGTPFCVDGNVYYSFPSPEKILSAGEDALSLCKLGFRTKYILDAAKCVVEGKITEEKLSYMSDSEAEQALMTIRGVGPKVASCVLLYGLHRLSYVPVDVWMKKVFQKYFNSDYADLGEFGGVVQQYLFFRERFIIEGKKI